jgi:cytochrome c biogenesis factor
MAEQARPSALGVIVRESLTVLGNCVVFFCAFIVGVRVVYPLVFSLLGMGRVGPGLQPPVSEEQAMVLSISLAFLAGGGLTALWTRHAPNVIATSGAMFLLGMIVLAQAMYLADRGDPAMMWRYSKPGLSQYVGAAVAAGAAILGWYALPKFCRRAGVRASAVEHGAVER